MVKEAVSRMKDVLENEQDNTAIKYAEFVTINDNTYILSLVYNLYSLADKLTIMHYAKC